MGIAYLKVLTIFLLKMRPFENEMLSTEHRLTYWPGFKSHLLYR